MAEWIKGGVGMSKDVTNVINHGLSFIVGFNFTQIKTNGLLGNPKVQEARC